MSRLPVFEDTTWGHFRRNGELQYFTTINWGARRFKIVMVIGVKKLRIVLHDGEARPLRLTADFMVSSIIELERFAFDSVVYYLSQATPLVDAIQEPLPYWQH